MTFRKFDILLILQLVIIAVTNFIIAWMILQEHLRVSILYFSIVLVIEVIVLFRFISKNNYDIFRFLESVKHRDELTKLNLQDSKKSHRELRKLLNEIADSYSRVKIEKESEHHYFLNTIKHVGVGLISFDNNGNIELINEAAEKLLKLSNPKNISQFNKAGDHFDKILQELTTGKPQLIKIKRRDEILQLSLNATSFIIKSHKVKLVSLQDIRSEIQQEEIEIWQKLIRVLTHEIMNSAGPITSLSSTLSQTFAEEFQQNEQIENTIKKQFLIGLQAIEKRSRGLAKFVETYRSLTKIPKPVFSEIELKGLLEQIALLMEEELRKENVSLKIQIQPKTFSITADEKLISQVLINIIRNAIQSFETSNNNRIVINVLKTNDDQTLIEIHDNGPGISDEVREKIFIPFFTTREDGSGIGLSLSRQIMNLHGGSINIKTNIETGTTVELML
ncbi:MAG: ATP-binding protein [Bacteroidales bacterium]